MRENHALVRLFTSEGKSCFRKVCCKGGKTKLKKGLLQVRENHALERFVASEGNICCRKVCCK